MNLRLALLRLHLPARLRAAGLRDLAAAVATSAGTHPPDFAACRPGEALGRFVEFMGESARVRAGTIGMTGDCAGDADARLERAALDVGRRLRDRLGVATRAESLVALALLYRAIGIDWRTSPEGAVTVCRCAFASRFDPEACRFASALDRGVVAGLTGGGRLRFDERITEGRPACRARIDFPEAGR